MFRYITVAAVVAALSLSLVERLRNDVALPSPEVAAIPARPPEAQSSSSRTVVIPARDGQFATEATVNGRSMNFLVDTGASLIAIRESDAAGIGIRPFPDDYKIPISTANGKGVAASAELKRVEIGGIEVRDIQAIIVPDSALSVNLLGMSFLSRVRFAHEPGRLVLEQ
jgi:aspartyl protease family protein